jgi:hypothetical protein
MYILLHICNYAKKTTYCLVKEWQQKPFLGRVTIGQRHGGDSLLVQRSFYNNRFVTFYEGSKLLAFSVISYVILFVQKSICILFRFMTTDMTRVWKCLSIVGWTWRWSQDMQ